MQEGHGRIFISHSSADRAAAEALAAQLESEGARTWIAPRDVNPGRDYSAQLDEAIAGCMAVVLVVSAATARSSAVRGEAEQAARDGKQIFPVRIAEVDVGNDLPLLGAVKYWTDGFGPNAGRNVGRLAEELSVLSGPAAAAPPAPVPAVPAPAPAPAPPVPDFAAPPAPSGAPPAPSNAPPAPSNAPPAPAYAPAPSEPAYAPPAPAHAPAPQAYPQPAAAYAPAPAYVPPAPAHAQFRPQATAPGGEHEEMLRAYVGPNADHYIARWQAMAATGSPRSWNWAAFLLSMFWLAYRKMWQTLGLFVGGFVLLQLMAIMAPQLGMLANGASLGLAAWCGWMGNGLYRKHVEQAVAAAQSTYPDPSRGSPPCACRAESRWARHWAWPLSGSRCSRSRPWSSLPRSVARGAITALTRPAASMRVGHRPDQLRQPHPDEQQHGGLSRAGARCRGDLKECEE